MSASELNCLCLVFLASHDSNAMTGQMMHLVSCLSGVTVTAGVRADWR